MTHGSLDVVSPDLLVDAVLAYQKTGAIRAALSLDLFSAIPETDGTPETIGPRVDASVRGVRILCDYLTVQGFLAKEGTRYRLTPSTAMFLTQSSPAYMGSIADFMASPEMIALWLDDPPSYVRNGGSPGLANIAPDNPVWVKFARAMAPFMAAQAAAIAAEVAGWQPPVRRVLDIAAGHGMFGIAVGKAVAGAEITALDWPAVLQVAEANAREAGLANRYRLKPGSAFDLDWDSDLDLVLLTNFLHHFDSDTCTVLLAKARQSLRPQGRVIALEFVPNEDRISPARPATFAFMMLASTPKGDAYTEREYAAMGKAAGLGRMRLAPTHPSPQSMLIFDRD
jgi:2-polyprenyl-3-methyl-5-hydroxy-6-metoxy-1,4-benzoquinol methylase